MVRCKSWSPTNQVNCLILTTGIDRRSITTTHFSVRRIQSAFIVCLLVGQYSSSFLKRKSLNYQKLTQPGDGLFGKFTSENDNPKSFFLCSFKQNWMAFTTLRVQNFSLADSLTFTNNRSLSRSQDNFALCQVYVRS